MIHPNDYDAMEKMFRGEAIPEDVKAEYDVVRKMANCYSVSGPLGPNLVIPMLRKLGYGRVEQKPQANVDWRSKIGERVLAQYGDKDVDGILIGLGINGRLSLDLEGYGEVELPRHCVRVPPSEELIANKEWWEVADEGTPVVVHDGDKSTRAKFVAAVEDGIKVRIGSKEQVYTRADVELKV